MGLQAIDNGEFVNVIVDGDEFGECFTMDKQAREWGAAPSDNLETWNLLLERAKITEDEAESALNKAVELAGITLPQYPVA